MVLKIKKIKKGKQTSRENKWLCIDYIYIFIIYKTLYFDITISKYIDILCLQSQSSILLSGYKNGWSRTQLITILPMRKLLGFMFTYLHTSFLQSTFNKLQFTQWYIMLTPATKIVLYNLIASKWITLYTTDPSKIGIIQSDQKSRNKLKYVTIYVYLEILIIGAFYTPLSLSIYRDGMKILGYATCNIIVLLLYVFI